VVVGGWVVVGPGPVTPPVALPPDQVCAPEATVRPAGTASVVPFEKLTVIGAPVMFEATYVRAPFLTNTLASGWFAVIVVSTVPSAARLRIQWKVCALLSPSSEVNPLLARKLASAASPSPVAR